jgi:hypothetical protein
LKNILSPWFHLFESVLYGIDQQSKASPSEYSAEYVLVQLNQISTQIGSTNLVQGIQQPVKLSLNAHETEPVQSSILGGRSEYGDIDLTLLLTSLSTRNIVRLLACILLERRIIISSDSLHKTSMICLGLGAILFPLAWQNIFIPVLPESLVHYCCAPMPFIVGVHSSSLYLLETMPLEEVIYLIL